MSNRRSFTNARRAGIHPLSRIARAALRVRITKAEPKETVHRCVTSADVTEGSPFCTATQHVTSMGTVVR